MVLIRVLYFTFDPILQDPPPLILIEVKLLKNSSNTHFRTANNNIPDPHLKLIKKLTQISIQIGHNRLNGGTDDNSRGRRVKQ
jgi:hypothetical protein